MTNAHDHAVRRKLLGRGFSQSYLRTEWESNVRSKVEAAVECIKNDARNAGGEVDVRKWWQMLASDVTSGLMFGESFDSLKVGKHDPWFEDVRISTLASTLAMMLPWIYSILKRVPGLRESRFFNAHRHLLEKGHMAVANSKASGTSLSLFAKVQAESDEARLSGLEISVEAASFMVAGSDTTSNTLTFLIWSILRDPSLQKALEEELAAIETPLSDQILTALPVLHAAIQETLRLYNAAPGPLPRIVPPGGVEMGGHFLPGGTKVATQSYTMHRDPDIYSDPDRFDHTRWMPSGAATLSEKASLTAFGGGSYNCIGQHLAYMQLRYGAALFFQRCKGARLAPSTTDESMIMEILVIGKPVGDVCKVMLDDC